MEEEEDTEDSEYEKALDESLFVVLLSNTAFSPNEQTNRQTNYANYALFHFACFRLCL